MMINSLEKMTDIVEANKSLDWIGWDVVERKYSPTACKMECLSTVSGTRKRNLLFPQTVGRFQTSL
jgi:hypothetical protein